MDKKHIRNSILTSQRCQRNYDVTKQIPQEDLDLIELSITQCPSKQNIAYYNAHMITDRKVIEKIHEYSAGLSAKAATDSPENYVTNPQVLGNLCIVFTTPKKNPFHQVFDKRTGNVRVRNHEQYTMMNDDSPQTKESAIKRFEQNQNIALGIAAGYSNLVAAELGYRSGCSSCLKNDEIKKLLGIEEDVLLLMGIGFNDDDRNRREHHYDENFIFPSHTKEDIEITWHK